MNTRPFLKSALIGLNQTPLDWPGNLGRIRAARDEARAAGAQLLCFPELSVSGYGCEDTFLWPDTHQRAMRHVQELAAECGDEIMLIGLPVTFEGKPYNGVAVLHQGNIRGISLKSHLAREGIHYEPRWFNPWPMGRQAEMQLGAAVVPVGHLLYEAAGLLFTVEICEDAWVAPEERPCGLMPEAQWVFNASASHFSLGKADIREKLVRESSRRFNVGYAYANLVGCESGRAIYDGELLVAEHGVVTARSNRLYMAETRCLFHQISYEPKQGGHVHLDLTTQSGPTIENPPAGPREYESRDEEFARAAALALFDYMCKSRSRGYTLSLSGGVDSAAVAVLVWITAHRVVNELSREERQSRLSWYQGLDPAISNAEALVGVWLKTAYQATRNSGPVTRRAAAELSRAIGAVHYELDIDALVEGYKSSISNAIGRDLEWDRDDITLQNIQARVRGPSVWMLANLDRSLLLSTSNRSEVAVGYATMDGDTCGGLAPIAGVEKTFLRRWLLRIQQEGLPGVPPLPALKYVNEQEPTAELRPPEAAQEDEKDLMPYEILDGLEAQLIARRRTPSKAWEALVEMFGDKYDAEQLRAWTEKFCRMFVFAQWKRERYAPAFHLDERNLDPKTWARFPILRGAFDEELSELKTQNVSGVNH